jgi:pimeloyl-ACP methyl ester carboxylesterase
VAITSTQITIDDRTFTVYEHGRRDGPAVLYHHGTPTSGAPLDHWLRDIDTRGARWVSYDRPGYGDSSPMPGRRVGDAAADCAAILDALDIERFTAWGISGGGPHALACAALLPERCTAVAVLGGVAPFEAHGLNYFAEMGRSNWVEFGLTLAGREYLEPFLRQEAQEMLTADPAELAEMLASLVVGPDRDHTKGWVDALPQAFRHRVAGWLDDDLAFVEPFGFELGEIRTPTLIVHGRQDSFVPLAHAEWMARTEPNAEAWILDDEAHLSLMGGRVAEVHDWLLGRT